MLLIHIFCSVGRVARSREAKLTTLPSLLLCHPYQADGVSQMIMEILGWYCTLEGFDGLMGALIYYGFYHI